MALFRISNPFTSDDAVAVKGEVAFQIRRIRHQHEMRERVGREYDALKS